MRRPRARWEGGVRQDGPVEVAAVQAMQVEEGRLVASWQRTLRPCALGNLRLGTLWFPVPAWAWP